MKQSCVLIAVAALAVGSAAGCRSTSPDEGPEDDRTEAGSTQAKVTGEASYLVRMAVPPEAVLTVRLEDVSIADASAAVLGEQVIEMQGRQVPIPFEIPYDTSRIDERHRYVVRATIHLDERMMFTSTEAHPVLTQGSPATVQVLMQPVRSQEPTPSTSPLVGTYWKLAELNGVPAPVQPSGREAHILLEREDNRFVASGGVNSLSGSYELDGDALKLVPGPMTLMAGSPEEMEQERAFLEAIKSVTSSRISGNELTLLAGDVAVLRFQAVQLP